MCFFEFPTNGDPAYREWEDRLYVKYGITKPVDEDGEDEEDTRDDG
jgi:hypothetical protein